MAAAADYYFYNNYNNKNKNKKNDNKKKKQTKNTTVQFCFCISKWSYFPHKYLLEIHQEGNQQFLTMNICEFF